MTLFIYLTYTISLAIWSFKNSIHGFLTQPSGTTGYCSDYFGNAPRNSILGPGTVQNNGSLSRTIRLGDTRSFDFRANLNNAFNTVQYQGVDTTYGTPQWGQVTSVGGMRSFSFSANFRY